LAGQQTTATNFANETIVIVIVTQYGTHKDSAEVSFLDLSLKCCPVDVTPHHHHQSKSSDHENNRIASQCAGGPNNVFYVHAVTVVV